MLNRDKTVIKSTPDYYLAILMSTYNHEHFIAQAIEGVTAQQTNYNYRLFIIDDCSTDKTYDICKHYSDIFPDKIILSRNGKNMGANKTGEISRELGFNSVAKYIAFCEGDDYWTDPLKLQQQFDFLEKNNDYVLTFHDILMIDALGNTIERDRLPDEDKKDYEKDALLIGPYLPTPTLFFRKFDLKKHRIASEKALNVDTLLLSILTQIGKTKYLSNIAGSCVRVHSGGVWSSKSYLEKWKYSLQTLQVIFSGLSKEKRKYVFAHYNNAFEMASGDADYYKSTSYWYIYNYSYIRFCLLSGHFGKAWLIMRRILNKKLTK